MTVASKRGGDGHGPMLAATLGMVLLAGAVALGGRALGSTADEAREIPAPLVDAAPAASRMQVAILAGGCFWGVQGVFQHVEGVAGAVSGYAGGDRATADYGQVSGGRTRHAEAVRVTFDPGRISYGRILQIFFSVAHDPTQLNRQGPDRGPQYRSAVFPTSAEQAKVASAYIAQLGGSRAYPARVVTAIEQGAAFFPAEPYHQDFMTRNPGHPYIVANDAPKVAALRRLFPSAYRGQPVLVAGAGS